RPCPPPLGHARARERPPPHLFPYTTLFRSAFDGHPETGKAGWKVYEDPTPTAPASTPAQTDLSDCTCEACQPKVLTCADCHAEVDRKSTRLNSSHVAISYAVFCLKKKSYTK